MTRITSFLTSATVAVAVAATLTSPLFAEDKGTVGIALPTRSSPRWISDGDTMVKLFIEAGYATDLQYADDDIPNQLSQIRTMIANNDKVLVIAAVDGTSLSNVLETAAAAGIRVIAYDRLILGSGNVDYHATFDNFQAGVLQATSLVAGLEERFPGVKPWNIELFGGAPDDVNAVLCNDGAMSVLQPMIDSGKISVPSGQIGMDRVGTPRGDTAMARTRMDHLLSTTYTGTALHGALSPDDNLSFGILTSLKRAGYGLGDLILPIVTGQGAEVPSVKSIIAGEQYSTLLRDSRELAKLTAGMVNALMGGAEPTITDTITYDNGVKVVPSYLLVPVPVDALNYQAAIVDSGYITADELQ